MFYSSLSTSRVCVCVCVCVCVHAGRCAAAVCSVCSSGGAGHLNWWSGQCDLQTVGRQRGSGMLHPSQRISAQRLCCLVSVSTHTHMRARAHTHTRLFLWKVGIFYRRNGFILHKTVCEISLHLNLALTGNCAFLLYQKRTHSVWFISVLKSVDMGCNVLISHLLLVIPMSYPCHYTNVCPHLSHKKHTLTKYFSCFTFYYTSTLFYTCSI